MEILPLPEPLAPAAAALWREAGLCRPWNDPVADLARALAGHSSTVLALVEADRLVGTVMVGHDGHRGWVYYLAVRGDRRGRGHGRRLMGAAESWLAERGVPKVQLMVRKDNAPVVAFYDALGYTDQEVVVLGRFLDEGLQALRQAGQAASSSGSPPSA